MIQELVKRYPVLDAVKDQIEEAYKILETCYENGGKLLIAGNGGSAADSDHIVGELMKGFVKRRPVSAELAEALKQADPERGAELAKKLQGGLPAIALTNHAALSSAFANDVDGMLSYAESGPFERQHECAGSRKGPPRADRGRRDRCGGACQGDQSPGAARSAVLSGDSE